MGVNRTQRFVMFTPAQKFALRRMKLEEIIAKLEQIEQQANSTIGEYPGGPVVERQRLVAALARQIKSQLKHQLRYGPRASVGLGGSLDGADARSVNDDEDSQARA